MKTYIKVCFQEEAYVTGNALTKIMNVLLL